jgi:transcriptional regulator with XRE-family HTH domain
VSSKKRLTDTQRAVVALRQHRQMTQQGFAVYLNIAITTVARWETFRPPSGASLKRLLEVAEEFGRRDLADIFWSAIVMEKNYDLQPDDPIHVLTLAIVRLHMEASRPTSTPTAMEAYRQVVSAIAKAHGVVKDEIDARKTDTYSWTDTDFDYTQFQLERLAEQLKQSKGKKKSR